MSVLSCSKKLVSSAFKSSGLLEQTGVFRSVCSVAKARCHSRCFTTNVALSRCQLWHHAFNRPLGKTRLFSKLCAESRNSKRSTAVFPEESQEMDTDSSQKFSEKFTLDVLVSLLRQENAVDICVIKVPEQIKYAEYFIVVSGASPRHLRAMALYAIKVYKFLKKDGELNAKIEGKDAEDWMCIDFGNMVVHFMLPETREVYELEKLWTLRAFDEQLQSIPAETLPEDFIYDAEVTK